MLKEVPTTAYRPGDERGQTLAEHSLILAFVAIGCIALLGALGLIIAGEVDSLSVAFP